MMLFKLSIKNIKKSIKDYAIYFVTLIIGVAIFYIFNAIDSQTVMMNVSSNTRDIIKLMTNFLSGLSVFVSFILGFLIIYASRFLIKRRNREFGIYLTLGMGKRKISTILFFETLLIGIISLIVGLVLGIGLSQFMSIVVANMFEADLTKFTFTYSQDACIKALIYFSIMYFIVMIFNTINISKCKLIDLLHANKKSEKIKFKNTTICTIIFLISVIMLGYAYYIVTLGIESMQSSNDIFKPIILGVISTFLIFWSLSGLILKMCMSSKKLYYKKLNSFTIRQVSSKINTTVISMSIICLMLFVTICVFSSAISIKNSMSQNIESLAPMDIELSKVHNLNEEIVNNDWRYNSNMILDSNLTLRETLKKMDYDIETNLKDIIEFSIYDLDIKLKDTLGTFFNEVVKRFPYMNLDVKEDFMKLSDYNKMAESFNLEKHTLKSNEYIIVADYQDMSKLRDEALKLNTAITINNEKYYPKFSETNYGFKELSSNHMNSGFFVVPDEAIDKNLGNTSYLIANYNAASEKEKNHLEDMLRDLEKHPYAKYTNLNLSTKKHIYESSIGLGAMVTFIGLYLGIIFLISSAAILALKELSESTDNKERYRMLRKLGADEKILNHALFNQIAIFFIFPLIIAIIHSIFGIIFCNYILSSIGTECLLPSIFSTAIFIIIIYGGYFLVTYYTSKNIIKE